MISEVQLHPYDLWNTTGYFAMISASLIFWPYTTNLEMNLSKNIHYSLDGKSSNTFHVILNFPFMLIFDLMNKDDLFACHYERRICSTFQQQCWFDETAAVVLPVCFRFTHLPWWVLRQWKIISNGMQLRRVSGGCGSKNWVSSLVLLVLDNYTLILPTLASAECSLCMFSSEIAVGTFSCFN